MTLEPALSANRLKTLSYSIRVLSLLGLVAALLFLGFFDLTKHNPYFSSINLFIEDPFDAVSSFGVILAAGGAGLGMLGSFRPHVRDLTHDDLQQAVNRTGITLLTCLVCLEADFFAFIFHRQAWMPFQAGWWLLALTVAFYLLCLGCGLGIFHYLGGYLQFNWKPIDWALALLYILNGVALAYFPATWRSSIPGSLAAILLGLYFLFFGLHFYGGILVKPLEEDFLDMLEHLQDWYAWKKRKFTFARGFFAWLGRLGKTRFVQGAWSWLNPRRHAWGLLTLAGVGLGAALLLSERIVEGPSPRGVGGILLAIYLGFMLLEVGLAYGLLNRRLGIFRRENR